MTGRSFDTVTLRKRFAYAFVYFAAFFIAAAGIRFIMSRVFKAVVITDFTSLKTEGLKLHGEDKNKYKFKEEDSHLYVEAEGVPIRSVEFNILKIMRPEDAPFERTAEVYYDTGNGFAPKQYTEVAIGEGANRVFFDTLIPVRAVRIDFFNGTGYRIKLQDITLNPETTGPLWIPLLFGAAALALLTVVTSGCRKSRFTIMLFAWSALMIFMGIPYLRCVRNVNDMNASFLILGIPAVFLTAVLLMEESPLKERLFPIALCLTAFALYALWAYVTPFAEGPDEAMHHDVVYYIAQHGVIPRGDTKEIRNEIWGFSYAYLPILPYIIGGYIEYIAIHLFKVESWNTLVMCARSVSIVSGVLTVYFTWKTAQLVFQGRNIRYAVPCIAGFLPEMAFLNTYVNSDSMAVMSTAVILYFWALGMKNGWRIRDAVGLSVGMSVCALTYYNCYGFILMSIPFFFGSMYLCGKSRAETIRMTAFIVLLTFALCGWWFIRNIVIYNGAVLGRSTLNRHAEIFAANGYRPSQILSPKRRGMSLMDMIIGEKWLVKTSASFIAMFSRFLLRAKTWVYIAYVLFFMISLLCSAAGFAGGRGLHGLTRREREKKWLFRICALMTIVIVVILALIYSYAVDFQPQGRYIMPCIVPASLLFGFGFDSLAWLVRKNRIIENVQHAHTCCREPVPGVYSHKRISRYDIFLLHRLKGNLRACRHSPDKRGDSG
ncbi:MAG: hypothetical protein Q4G47_00600 [Lachnospiraceae bacterium]|nr:hypothetical protein [Lachnospiraceae bacterium]